MQTRLSQFCRDLDRAIRPLLTPVENVSARLGDGAQSLPLFEGLPALRDGTHKARLLIEKLSRQQSYVLIFGPLKSGKSTLMNAMTGAYVSEVTSLPAYPCLVYVSDAERPQYSLTKYDGNTEQVADATALRARVEKAHLELAQQLRAAERAPEGHVEFDPAIQFPQAIRKVDARVPAGKLEQSAAVLVDTPGLYSRMKFGYDQMTRDFRDTAACAVFVVKTDNLFLEQVFEEFHELLELFGRIFLVVNLDGTKRDLREDGTLVPSLESENPAKVLEAFENLSMSAPLKRAADEGRLRIYPVDLLQAASARLKASTGSEDPTEALRHTGFEALERDMTDYLNSSEYYQTFVNDSLRYAKSVLTSLIEVSESEEVTAITGQAKELEGDVSRARARQQVLDRLADTDWDAAREDTKSGYLEFVKQLAQKTRQDAIGQAREVVRQWFESDAPLSQLIDKDFDARAQAALDAFGQGCRDQLGQLVGSPTAGLPATGSSAKDLALIEVPVAKVRDAAIAKAGSELQLDAVPLEIPYDEIPVRRGLWDWVLFRRARTLRAKLLGEESAPNRPITAEQKEKHLGANARAFILECAIESLDKHLPSAFERVARDIWAAYGREWSERLLAEISGRQRANHQQLEAAEKRLSELSGIADGFRDLAEACAQISTEVAAVDQDFATEPPDDDSMILEIEAG